MDVRGLSGKGKLTVLANPNAPTGLALPLDQVEALVASNPGHVVVVDEAYVDFGAASAAALLGRYENLLVVMTYSKSRSMQGPAWALPWGSRELIADLERLKYATNPYNVNRLTLRLGEAAVDSDPYFRANARADHGHPGQDRPGALRRWLSPPGFPGQFSVCNPPPDRRGPAVSEVQGAGHSDPPFFRPGHCTV